jgi:hypothetical protein
MAVPLLTRRRILAAKIETTIGTAVSLAAADAGFKVEDRALKIVRESGRRQKQGTGGNDVAIAEAAHTELTFTARVHGKGASGIPAWALAFLPSAGFVATAQVYARTWDTSNFKSLSVGHYQDGVKMLGRGMMGNLKFTLVPGMMCNVEGNYQGGWVADPTDVALLSTITYETVKPPIWVPGAGNAFTINGSTAVKPSKLEIDLGNEVSLREDQNSAGGYCSAFVTAGAAKFTMDPEAMLRAVTAADWHSLQSNNTTFAISAVLDGGTNNTITFGATVQVVSAPDWADRNGKVSENVVMEEIDDSLTVSFS